MTQKSELLQSCCNRFTASFRRINCYATGPSLRLVALIAYVVPAQSFHAECREYEDDELLHALFPLTAPKDLATRHPRYGPGRCPR